MYDEYNFNCTHTNIEHLSNCEIGICKFCGCLMEKMMNYFTIKSNIFCFEPEHSVSSYIQSMVSSSNTYFKNMILTYPYFQSNILRRKIIIRKMKSLINRLKFKDKTLHLAIYLMDVVINKDYDTSMVLEQIAVGCLVAASK
jgi:hypothetical protein